jgi:hypothetical protein
LKELGLGATPDWTWDEFRIAKVSGGKNQYGYGMRGGGTWALLYRRFALANGAEVLRTARS